MTPRFNPPPNWPLPQGRQPDTDDTDADDADGQTPKPRAFDSPSVRLVAVVGTLILVGFIFGPPASDEAADPAASKAAAESSEAKAAAASKAVAAESAKAQNLADRVETKWLDVWMVDTPSEIAADRPGLLEGYVVDWESTNSGMVDVMLSLGSHQVSQYQLDTMAHSIMTLTGLDVEDLDRVEVHTADWEGSAVVYRANVPGLMP
ncbi:hypothetical protein ACX8Z9_04585 [Arthrobacter halodurans]|uniref:Uncharacterized protein n=1 Tax=Arthrobacter halodurans TaxID=516699 RepID=A0ABV4UPU7_9MICC